MLSPVRGPAAGHSPSRGHSGLPSSPGGGHHHRPTSGHLQKSHPEGRKRLGNVGGHTHQSPSHHVEYTKNHNQHHPPIRQPSHSPSRAREVLSSATTNSSARNMSPLMTRYSVRPFLTFWKKKSGKCCRNKSSKIIHSWHTGKKSSPGSQERGSLQM